ncbi:Asp23/Gls24 family envelope stress response protein [Actinoplanes sp. NPDC049681]|uniref:Asp23/Gls24 family envelope stress response protein n=1 Tax=Actinoplanes sp. NPDC049681 TaxID=3363905 RepID=UPI00379B165B
MTTALTNNEPTTPTTPARSTAEAVLVPRQSRLNSAEGKIIVAENVVQKIAGIACREVSGVQAMGSGSTRAFGALRERIPGSNGPNVAQGVGVEVGETEAAIDLDIVVEYGISIADLGRSIQRNVKNAIERMTGLDVVEVNVSVDDVHMPDAPENRPESRVS